MRWPFRRRGTATPEVVPEASPEPVGPAARLRRAWQVLPPLSPTVGPPTRFLPIGLPRVSGVRSLVHRPPVAPVDVPAGRVTGLADTLPALDLERPSTPDVPPVETRVRAVDRPVASAPITVATEEYVGEAREPAVPHRAPAWLRALSGAPVMDPLLGMLPSQPTPKAPPRPVEQPLRPASVTRARRPRNRVGLGAPLTPDETEPEPGHVDSAPYALTRELAATYGADLDAVPVHRGGDTDRRAEQLRASAFTEDGAVHLPAAAGPLDSTESRALLAHELVHVAQQRHRGGTLPDESTPGGADLEAQAQAVEAAVRAGAPLPKLTHPAVPEPPAQVAPERAAGPPPGLPPGSPPGPPPAVTTASAPPPPPGAPAPPVAAPSPEPRPPAGFPNPISAGPPPSAATGSRRPAARGAGAPVPAYEPLLATGVSGTAVRGRVQRRPVDLAHPATAPHSTAPQSTAPQSTAPQHGAQHQDTQHQDTQHAGSPPPTQPSPTQATHSGSSTPPSGHSREQRYDGPPRNGSEFAQLVSNTVTDSVSDFWMLDVDTGPQSGGGGGGSGDRGRNSQGGGLTPAEKQERFDEMVAIRLDTVNEERQANGQAPIHQLPYEEEQAIWRRIDGGTGGRRDEPIRTWSDVGDAALHDYIDLVGEPFGLDTDALLNATRDGDGAGDDNARPGDRNQADAAGAPAAAEGHGRAESGRPQVETDDLDLDELAGKLYDRIRSKLRLELLLDRERAGLLSDFR